jgi:hypothetical protein
MDIHGFGHVELPSGETWVFVRDRGSVIVAAPRKVSLSIFAVPHGMGEDSEKSKEAVRRQVVAPSEVTSLGTVNPAEFAWANVRHIGSERHVHVKVGPWTGSANLVAIGLKLAGLHRESALAVEHLRTEHAWATMLRFSTTTRMVAVMCGPKGMPREYEIAVTP